VSPKVNFLKECVANQKRFRTTVLERTRICALCQWVDDIDPWTLEQLFQYHKRKYSKTAYITSYKKLFKDVYEIDTWTFGT
jgi:hypothetical protein